MISDQTLAAKVDYLFRTIYPRGRGPYTYSEVAAAIEAATGESVSPSTLSRLRTGQLTNPRIRIVEGLADFFGVPLEYFRDDDAAGRVSDEVAILAALRDSGITQAHLRALSGLSPQAREMVAKLIEHTIQLEEQRQA